MHTRTEESVCMHKAVNKGERLCMSLCAGVFTWHACYNCLQSHLDKTTSSQVSLGCMPLLANRTFPVQKSPAVRRRPTSPSPRRQSLWTSSTVISPPDPSSWGRAKVSTCPHLSTHLRTSVPPPPATLLSPMSTPPWQPRSSPEHSVT